MKEIIIRSLSEAKQGLDNLLSNEKNIESISNASKIMLASLINGGTIFSCGNGGSMCDAMHFAEELSGRYRLDRKALAATAISDVGHMSCVSNDYGYQYVFSRYLEAHGKVGDVLLGISTSGSSKNIIEAANTAKKQGMAVITLTGKEMSLLSALSDIDICTPAGKYADRVQELHIKIIHILIELIEHELF